jgi:hypothetical protein
MSGRQLPLFLWKFSMDLRPTLKNLDGYLVLHPDGSPIFRCDKRKALWYIRRNLAKDIVSTEPTIQLTFEPKGRGHCGDPFYMAAKDIRCVVCGVEDRNEFTKHHIVPYMYRRLFPEVAKANNWHDVVLLCIKCHNGYERFANILKKDLARAYNAPFAIQRHDPAASLLKKAASALSRYRDTLPPTVALSKRQEIESILQRPVTDTEIDELAFIDAADREARKDFHAQTVITAVSEDLQSFIERWREHFLSTMKPKFMPEYWDIRRRFDDNGAKGTGVVCGTKS